MHFIKKYAHNIFLLGVLLLKFIAIACAKDPHNYCVVGLGGNCRVSTWLKALNLRFQAFPFDWVESEEIEGLIALINNDFDDYLLLENLTPFFNYYYNRVQDRIYKINLVHDFSFQGNENFSFAKHEDFKKGINCINNEYFAVYEKYKKRIQRFKDLYKNHNQIIFVRVLYIDKDSAILLHKSLKKTFNNKVNIMLIVINDQEDFKVDWNLEGIKNFYLPTLYLTTDGYEQHFLAILEGIIS